MVLGFDSRSKHNECEYIFHDQAWGIRERRGSVNRRKPALFEGKLVPSRNIITKETFVCVWVHLVIKALSVLPVCQCVGVQKYIKFGIYNASLYSAV